MKGISYLHDEDNRLKAVQIDAELYEEALQDFLDSLEANELRLEPKVPFNEVAKRILARSDQADV